MQSAVEDSRLQIMLAYANEIINDSMESKVLGTLFDEILTYRNHYRDWLGEASLQYQLATNLLTFSRVYGRTSETTECKLSEWLQKHDIHQVWFDRIKSNVESICTEAVC